VRYAKGSDESKPAEPFTADEIYWDIILPFENVSNEFWSKLAGALNQLWPESPAALTLTGYVREVNNQPGEAIGYYDLAIKKDEQYWIAAWGLAESHYNLQNWKEALHNYQKALESDLGREIMQVHFDAAWCLGKLGKHVEEEKCYRRCLDLDPDWPYARNNLGWSLYKQSRFAEALEIFDDCILRKVDKTYPVRNRARTLTKLGRLSDAITAWKQTGRSGKLSKYAQDQIAKLQARINSVEVGPVDEDDDADGLAEGESGKGRGN
jgi:tetratricopeptide (TPR) repeat protein